MVHFLLDRIINVHLKKNWHLLETSSREGLQQTEISLHVHVVKSYDFFFFAYMSTNQNLQTRYKPHSPYQITHNVFAGTNTVYYPLPFLCSFSSTTSCAHQQLK